MKIEELLDHLIEEIKYCSEFLLHAEQMDEPTIEDHKDYTYHYGKRDGLQDTLTAICKAERTPQKPYDGEYFEKLVHVGERFALWELEYHEDNNFTGNGWLICWHNGHKLTAYDNKSVAVRDWFDRVVHR